MNALTGMGSYAFTSKKFDLDLKNRGFPPAKLSFEDPLVVELKYIASHLRYMFLAPNEIILMIISAKMLVHQVKALL